LRASRRAAPLWGCGSCCNANFSDTRTGFSASSGGEGCGWVFIRFFGWGINAVGSGANPSSLSSSMRLVVNSGHTKNTSAVASVNRLTISSGATVTANHAITLAGTSPQFNINNLGLYIHNNTGVLSSTIFAGTETFNTTSTFQINNWQSSTITLISNLSKTSGFYYGNLIINWTGNTGAWQQNLSGTVNLVAKNLTINSTGNSSGLLLLTTKNAFVLNIAFRKGYKLQEEQELTV